MLPGNVRRPVWIGELACDGERAPCTNIEPIRVVALQLGTDAAADHLRHRDTQSPGPSLHLPVLGYLFRNRFLTSSNNELLLFITPRIIKG